MSFVESFIEGEVIYTKEGVAKIFKEQSDAIDLPFIFLSVGVSAELFQDTSWFAHEAGSTFLCGRATWGDGLVPFY